MRETVRAVPGYHVFLAVNWSAENVSSFILRLTRESDESSEGAVRRAIYQFDPEIVVTAVTPLAETRYRDMYHERFALSVLEVLSVVALFLTIVGLFSVLAYTVDRRMNEFGVRLVLGAVAVLLLLAAIAASVVPALRATRANVARLLRAE